MSSYGTSSLLAETMTDETTSTSLPGLLVVLSGPTGVGKTTVGAGLLASSDDYIRSISATTRDARGQEQDGTDYYFYSRERFEQELSEGKFLEHAEVHGKLYGTPLAPVGKALRERKVLVMIIDVDGGEQLRKLDLDALLVFLEPPSRDALLQRLAARGTEDVDNVTRRLKRVERELDVGKTYDAMVVNDDLESCVAKVDAVIQEQRQKLAQREAAGEKLYKELDRLGI